MKNDIKKRELAGVTSATNSVVSGNGTSGLIYALKTYTINVIAKDSSGTNINHGGDTFFVKITNQCTQSSNFACTEVSGARQTLSSPIQGAMTDNGDGTYTFNYSVPLDGAVTVVVQLLTPGGVYGEWFANTNWSGSPGLTNYTSDVDFIWSPGTNIVSGQSTLVTGKIYTKIKPPTTDTYTFYFTHDDGSKITVDGVIRANQLGSVCICFNTFQMSLTAGTYVDVEIFYFQNLVGALCQLEWSSSTIARQYIPSTYYTYPTNVASSPYQITVDCLTGYTGNDPSSTTTCKEICGDGIKVGTEKCDDGNKNNGDGCKNDCTNIETSWACTGGSVNAKDTCTFCSTGWYQNSLTNPQTCVSRCGDGVKTSNESCDDGNTISGDGCASDCKSEDGWICGEVIPGLPEICVQCDIGYVNNDNWSECIDGNIPRDTKTVAIFTIAAAVLGLASNLLIAALTSSTSSQSKFGMINQIQLLLALPLLNCYFPEKIMDFIKSMKSSLLSMSFLPTDKSSAYEDFKDLFKVAQFNSYMYLLDLKSGSAFVNVLNLSITVGFVILLHILISIIYLLFYKTSRCAFIKKILNFALTTLTFGFYIGVYIQAFLLICFVDFNEIITDKYSGKRNDRSIILAYVIISLIGLFILLALWQWCKSRNPSTFAKQKYFLALIEGMKPKWICRTYFMIFLIRRTLFCVIVFFFTKLSFTNKLIMYVSVQGVYFLYVIGLRPLKEMNENLMDSINEIFYCYYCAFLFFYNSQNHWTDTITDIYFWILVSNNIVIFLISFCVLIKTLFDLCRKWRNKPKVAPKGLTTITHIEDPSSMKVSKLTNFKVTKDNDPSLYPLESDNKHSMISFLPSKGNISDNSIVNEINQKYKRDSTFDENRGEGNLMVEESKERNLGSYGDEEIAVNRLKRAIEHNNAKFKIENFKRKRKAGGERINQDVRYDFDNY